MLAIPMEAALPMMNLLLHREIIEQSTFDTGVETTIIYLYKGTGLWATLRTVAMIRERGNGADVSDGKHLWAVLRPCLSVHISKVLVMDANLPFADALDTAADTIVSTMHRRVPAC